MYCENFNLGNKKLSGWKWLALHDKDGYNHYPRAGVLVASGALRHPATYNAAVKVAIISPM